MSFWVLRLTYLDLIPRAFAFKKRLNESKVCSNELQSLVKLVGILFRPSVSSIAFLVIKC